MARATLVAGAAVPPVRQLSEQSKQVQKTHKGPQHDTRARRSDYDGTSTWQRSAQSKRDRFPF